MNMMKLRSGATIPEISRKDADKKKYLTRNILTQLHLMPSGDPVAFENASDGSVIYYFDPQKVVEAPPELWYSEVGDSSETMILESGTEIKRMTAKRAAIFGYYTKEHLESLNYEIVEEPVAYSYKRNKDIVFFYDKKMAIRLPLMCIKCGEAVRFKRKLCQECYQKDLEIRRAEGNAYRTAFYGMKRSRVLFFDLELTGVYDHDEIISISIVDGEGTVIMDTLVKPAHKKKWKQTEKIHGITPEMTAGAATLEELTPEIKRIFAEADNIIAYGVSTDYSHIKYIYDSISEQEALHKKTRCCALEFVRFQSEHYPDDNHASLVDAMRTLNIGWDGIPHSSIADTIACMKVWEALFPSYYTTPMPELPDYSAMTPAAAPAFNEATGEYVRIETNAEDKEESYV